MTTPPEAPGPARTSDSQDVGQREQVGRMEHVGQMEPTAEVHPIEAESYRLLAERVDLAGWAPGPGAVAARVVHATAEPSLTASLRVDEAATDAAVAALRAGAPVLCDVEMVRVGITGADARCLLGEVADAGRWSTRSAAAMALALRRHPEGAVVVVGCAPSALQAACSMIDAGAVRPAVVIGVPVGFVGAAESKEELERVAARRGIPMITLRGERGGAAVAAATVNALWRLAGAADAASPGAAGAASPGAAGARPAPALFLMGHGTRSAAGEAEIRAFARAVADARPAVPVSCGFIEFCEPGLDDALDDAVATGSGQVVGVPLVLLGAGHMKDDGPAALARGRNRHPGVAFSYARDFGPHPLVLQVVAERIAEASAGFPDGRADAVVIVGRGSSDPDANAELARAARLLADGRDLGTGLAGHEPSGTGTGTGTGGAGSGPNGTVSADGPPPSASSPPQLGIVEPAYVSLARPGVPAALERCRRLGARHIAVVPYFLFTGVLIDRMAEQARQWAASVEGSRVTMGRHMGIDPRLVRLTWERYEEARDGAARMNCDGCLFRAPLPGYEHRVGAAPFTPSAAVPPSAPSAPSA